MKKLFGLGRGLESLIPAKNSTKIHPKIQDNIFYVEIHKVKPNPNQPRKDFDKESLKELASSIKKYGILQPLLVTKVETETDRGLDVEYELIAGERRWRAAQLLNLPHVPVIIKNDFDESRVKLEVALVENIQRSDLGALEEGEAYQRLASEFKLSHEEIAKRIGKSRPVVTNMIRILSLPADIKEAIRSGKVSRGHARGLLSFKDPAKQKEMFKTILAGNFSKADLEAVAQHYSVNRKAARAINPRFAELQQNLSKNLETPVIVKSSINGGSIIIKFTNLEELNKIAKTILD
mgnify:CR=1 FL=1